ncbi:rhodanese-like domain-containing protein 10 [Eucalyptus grandis]|uniref:rhodanese-like domain-containing protein 10 n=1 Tax=Eucalyptus grandis TaxID=71139 RepID=UPI00192EB9DC|nr:rhodanese-like domain-containing protein 10 [Eucalyptus grandis]
MAIRWNHLSTACRLPGTHGRHESSHQQHFLAPPRRPNPHHPPTPNAVPSSSARQLIESGAIRPIPPREAASAVVDGDYVMLDIRPEWEREKARVAGSLHVPLFVEDRDNGPLTLLKKWVHFGYIGLWTGQNFTTLNSDFVEQVEAVVPDKDARILVACGEGLRSMMAASKLYDHGYRNLGWLAGGFNRSKDSDFPDVEGAEKLQYATIGGASYFFLQLLILLQAVGKE